VLTRDNLVTYRFIVTNEDRVFKALADRTSRFLLDQLLARDGRTLTELESDLNMTRFGVMKHLRVLEDAGLVVTRWSGREKLHLREQGLRAGDAPDLLAWHSQPIQGPACKHRQQQSRGTDFEPDRQIHHPRVSRERREAVMAKPIESERAIDRGLRASESAAHRHVARVLGYSRFPSIKTAGWSAKLVQKPTLKVYSGLPHRMCTTHKDQINTDLLAFIGA